jgi:hypothetical protein
MLGIDNLGRLNDDEITTKNIALNQTPHTNVSFVNQISDGSAGK